MRQIRTWGDPVLRQKVGDLQEIDGSVARLIQDMIETMNDAPGVGLAATQIGVFKRIFVYDIGDGPQAVINPYIVESSGEWVYEEGCLSVPGLSWPITRPNDVLLKGLDLDGNPVEREGSELLGRVFQHEVDHLDGILLIERLDPDTKKQALKVLRERALSSS